MSGYLGFGLCFFVRIPGFRSLPLKLCIILVIFIWIFAFFFAKPYFEHWLLLFVDYVSFQVINPGPCVDLDGLPSYLSSLLSSSPSALSLTEFLDSWVDSVLDSLVLRPFLFIFVMKQILKRNFAKADIWHVKFELQFRF